MENKSVFGQRLRAARQKAGLTQAALGDLLGLVEYGAVRISRFECGKHMPDIGFAEKMAAVLKVPSFYFYCSDEALAKMFLLLSERFGNGWKHFLLTQMRDALAQQKSVASPSAALHVLPEMNADRRQNTSSWSHVERRTCIDRRMCADRRCYVERRSQIDRRSGQKRQSMVMYGEVG
jgi:transcriptional regulator with XRE-family HTH domain